MAPISPVEMADQSTTSPISPQPKRHIQATTLQPQATPPPQSTYPPTQSASSPAPTPSSQPQQHAPPQPPVQPASNFPPHQLLPPPHRGYTVTPRRKGAMFWWLIALLVAWIVLSALGGGLMGGGIASASVSCTGYYDTDCSYEQDAGLFWGGVACLSIAGLFCIAFWTLLVIYLVRRANAIANPQPIVYMPSYPSPMPMPTQGSMPVPPQGYAYGYGYGYPLQQQQVFQQQQQQQQPQQQQPPQQQREWPASTTQQTQQQRQHLSAPSAVDDDDQLVHSPLKQEGKACASCGTVTSTPFCPQCGKRIS